MRQNKAITILGGGNGAHAMAADLCSKDYTVRLFEMNKFRHNMESVFKTRSIEAVGEIQGNFVLDMVTDDINKAIDGVKYIMVVNPAYAHKDYAELLKGKVKSNQVIMTFPGSFAALIFKKIFGEAECPALVDSNDLPYNARLIGPGKVKIYNKGSVSIGFLPCSQETELITEIENMFSIKKVFSDVMECGLSIVNPALHSGPCLLNAGPIESVTTTFYLYEQGFTPAAAKVNKALDDERKAIALKLGYKINPFECFSCINEDYTWKDLYRAAHGDIGLTPICGPNDLNSRYLIEDASCGLVPWANIGKAVGADTTTISAIIDIYSVFHEKDWWSEGVTLGDLGLEGMSVKEMKEYFRTG